MNSAIRHAEDRGHVQHGWLDSKHSFSFASYRDPRHMGFSDLRVINEDVIAPGKGFPTHAHANMEIFTYVLSGAAKHEDSMGNSGIIRAGELQYMSAGSGVTHSEYNASSSEPLHLYQIWLHPETKGLGPRYEQLSLREGIEKNSLRRIAHSSRTAESSPENSREQSFPIRQDANIFVGTLEAGAGLSYGSSVGRSAWIQLLEGEIRVNSAQMAAGDGLSLEFPNETEDTLEIEADAKSLFLLFDLRSSKNAN